MGHIRLWSRHEKNLKEDKNTTENHESLLDASSEIVLGVNIMKTKYTSTSLHRTAR
jgi:hypothetical protein